MQSVFVRAPDARSGEGAASLDATPSHPPDQPFFAVPPSFGVGIERVGDGADPSSAFGSDAYDCGASACAATSGRAFFSNTCTVGCFKLISPSANRSSDPLRAATHCG